jgi:hypothetical protein
MSVVRCTIETRQRKENMSNLLNNIGYVSYDGNYGAEADLLVFDSSHLTSKQWDTLGELGDNSRYEYVEAILSGKSTSEWEL